MNFESTIKHSSLLGITKAYSITDEMVKKEQLFDDWYHCEGAISDTIDDFNRKTQYGSIEGDLKQGVEFMIEGDLPVQHSNTHRDTGGLVTYRMLDMAGFLAKSVANAVREQEEHILKANDPSFLNNDNQTLDMEFYLTCVIQRVVDMGIKDCTIMAIIDSSPITKDSYRDSELYAMAMSAPVNLIGLGTSLNTLDYFKRLDAIVHAFNTDYWLGCVGKVFTTAIEQLNKDVKEFSLSMGMGELVWVTKNHCDQMVIKSST